MNIIEQIKNLNSGVKSSICYILASFFTKGLAIITIPLFTRIMPSSEIGVVTIFKSWYSMIAVVSTLALTSGGFQLAMKQYESERDKYISSILSLTSCVVFFLSVIYLISPSFWNNITGLSTGLTALMIALLFFMPAQEFWLLRQRYEYKYKAATLVTFLSTFLAAMSSVVFVVTMKHRGHSELGAIQLYSNYSVILVFAASIFIIIILKGRVFFHAEYWKFSLALSLPLVCNSIAVHILNTSDRIMIGKMIGKSEAGIYGTLFTISSLSLIVWYAINASFIPFLYDNMENESKKEEIRSISFKILGLFSVLAFLLTLFAPETVRILATKEYYNAIYIIPPIAAGILLIPISNIYSNILIYHKKTQYIMISSIIAACINVSLNYYGIRKYGFVAAAYTTLIAHIVLGIVQGVVANRVHQQFSKAPVYNDKKLFILSLTTVLSCLFCIILYRSTVARYATIAIILIILIYNRRNIKALLNRS